MRGQAGEELEKVVEVAKKVDDIDDDDVDADDIDDDDVEGGGWLSVAGGGCLTGRLQQINTAQQLSHVSPPAEHSHSGQTQRQAWTGNRGQVGGIVLSLYLYRDVRGWEGNISFNFI